MCCQPLMVVLIYILFCKYHWLPVINITCCMLLYKVWGDMYLLLQFWICVCVLNDVIFCIGLITAGSTDTTVTLFDIGIPQGHNYKTDIRLFFTLCCVTLLCDIGCSILVLHCLFHNFRVLTFHHSTTVVFQPLFPVG